jgi:hypothetical protein
VAKVKQPVKVTKVKKRVKVTMKNVTLRVDNNRLHAVCRKSDFQSRVVKPTTINVEKVKEIAALSEITMESIRSVHRLAKSVVSVKLVGASAKDLASKIKDENVTTTGK